MNPKFHQLAKILVIIVCFGIGGYYGNPWLHPQVEYYYIDLGSGVSTEPETESIEGSYGFEQEPTGEIEEYAPPDFETELYGDNQIAGGDETSEPQPTAPLEGYDEEFNIGLFIDEVIWKTRNFDLIDACINGFVAGVLANINKIFKKILGKLKEWILRFRRRREK